MGRTHDNWSMPSLSPTIGCQRRPALTVVLNRRAWIHNRWRAVISLVAYLLWILHYLFAASSLFAVSTVER